MLEPVHKIVAVAHVRLTLFAVPIAGPSRGPHSSQSSRAVQHPGSSPGTAINSHDHPPSSSQSSTSPTPPTQARPAKSKAEQLSKNQGSSSTRRRLNAAAAKPPEELHRELSLETAQASMGAGPSAKDGSNSKRDRIAHSDPMSPARMMHDVGRPAGSGQEHPQLPRQPLQQLQHRQPSGEPAAAADLLGQSAGSGGSRASAAVPVNPFAQAAEAEAQHMQDAAAASASTHATPFAEYSGPSSQRPYHSMSSPGDPTAPRKFLPASASSFSNTPIGPSTPAQVGRTRSGSHGDRSGRASQAAGLDTRQLQEKLGQLSTSETDISTQPTEPVPRTRLKSRSRSGSASGSLQQRVSSAEMIRTESESEAMTQAAAPIGAQIFAPPDGQGRPSHEDAYGQVRSESLSGQAQMWPAHQKGDQPSYLSNDLTERHVPLSGVPVASPARSMGGMGSSMASMSPGMSQLVSPARISGGDSTGSSTFDQLKVWPLQQ